MALAVATTKFVFGMYDCEAGSDAGTGDFCVVLWILHMGGHIRTWDRTCLWTFINKINLCRFAFKVMFYFRQLSLVAED